MKFLEKKPQDFILSNGKCFSIERMIQYAFQFFNLNYKDYLILNSRKLKKNEVSNRKSDYRKYFNKNNINFESKIFGKKLIYKMINFYLKQNKI